MGQRPPPSNYGHCHQNYEPASTNPTAESWKRWAHSYKETHTADCTR